MGMPAGKLTPSPERGLAGGGNSGKTGAEKATYRALKDGQAIQRINAMNVAVPLVLASEAALDDFDDGGESRADALIMKCLLILEEAVESLVPPAPQPLPEPTTDRPPVEPDSKP